MASADEAAPVTRPSLGPPIDPAHDLAGALHEISNALTVVLGWIDRARGASDSPDEVERALRIAGDRASMARGIVRRAIGADAPEEPPSSVSDVVADAITGLEPQLARANMQAWENLDPAIAARTIDHAPTVLQILTNLLLNAIAMSPEGSTVRIEALSGGVDRVVFAVADDGPGVPSERRRTLFEAGVSTRAGGAGIGLRHAAALARSLGGALALGDADRGARFELAWPLVRLDASLPPPESGAKRTASATQPSPPLSLRRSMPLAGTRILLVEDDDAVVDLLDTALTARGADVVSIRHKGDLDGALATGPFDAALFDISPIQEDVRGAVASARGASDALRVVLISGSAAQMPALPDEWVAAWVRKPFEIAEILDALTTRPPGDRGSA